MLRFFGRKKEETKPEIDLPQAILKNKEAIETLEKRQVHLERRITIQDEDARRRAKEGDKRGAIFALKRKKMFEKELEQLGNAHLTLEQQIMSLESAQTQQVAVGALAAGVIAQKALNQQLNITKLDDLIDDLQEQTQLQNELSNMLSQGISSGDDSELLAELHEIEAKQLEEALIDIAPVPTNIPALYSQQIEQSSQKQPIVSYGSVHSSIGSFQDQISDEEQLKQLMKDLA